MTGPRARRCTRSSRSPARGQIAGEHTGQRLRSGWIRAASSRASRSPRRQRHRVERQALHQVEQVARSGLDRRRARRPAAGARATPGRPARGERVATPAAAPGRAPGAAPGRAGRPLGARSQASTPASGGRSGCTRAGQLKGGQIATAAAAPGRAPGTAPGRADRPLGAGSQASTPASAPANGCARAGSGRPARGKRVATAAAAQDRAPGTAPGRVGRPLGAGSQASTPASGGRLGAESGQASSGANGSPRRQRSRVERQALHQVERVARSGPDRRPAAALGLRQGGQLGGERIATPAAAPGSSAGRCTRSSGSPARGQIAGQRLRSGYARAANSGGEQIATAAAAPGRAPGAAPGRAGRPLGAGSQALGLDQLGPARASSGQLGASRSPRRQRRRIERQALHQVERFASSGPDRRRSGWISSGRTGRHGGRSARLST